MNYLVYTLVLDGSGNLYAGGRFDLAGGVPTNYIANWRGTNWSALGTGVDSYGVQAVATDAGGTLCAGGAFTTAGGVTANHIAKWNGMSWSAFGTGGDANIMYALAVSVSGNLDAGGNFTIASGAIQTGGPTRTFSTDANYFCTGAAAQVTGAGLPPTVRNLTNATLGAPLTLSQPVAVRQVLTQNSSANLVLNGNALALLSGTVGTAPIYNQATGIVSGNTGTMQRHTETNTGTTGYRHYSSPVGGEMLNTLATSGYAPDFSGEATYNASSTPGTVSPFPMVFQYNQDRIPGTTSNYSPFDKGYEAITSGSAAMEVGRGYAVNAPGTALVDFPGTFTTGNVTRTPRNRTGINGGWHLLGNPYPSPLDWSILTQGTGNNLENVDGAVYVFQSSGPCVGSYRTYLVGAPGRGSPLVPTGSGFFVYTITPDVAGTLRLTNANRVTAFGAQPAFGRSITDPCPLVQLDLRGSSGLADALYAYAQVGATLAYEPVFDAGKLPNTMGLDLASTATSGESQTIDGRPVFVAATVLPLRVGVPAAGTYTVSAAVLNNLPTGLDAYLRDAQTGQAVNLRTQPADDFTVTAAQATAVLTGRFTLAFSAAALATTAGLAAGNVSLYPNPAYNAFAVQLPGVAGAATVQVELLNALGQMVRRQSAALPASGATLRLQAGTDSLAKRVVLN